MLLNRGDAARTSRETLAAVALDGNRQDRAALPTQWLPFYANNW
jgi:hypothetical protein